VCSIEESPFPNIRELFCQELLWIHDSVNMVAMSLIALWFLPTFFLIEVIEVTLYNFF
jgi:hypothetical protein